MFLEQAKRILAALEKEDVAYVLVGAMALAAHGLVRATRDIDIFVSPREDNVRRLVKALKSLYDDPAIDGISADDLAGKYPALEYVPPEATFSIDILARLGEAFQFEDLEYDRLDLDGTPARVATAKTLYRMKRDTVRQQDAVDAAWLRDVFGLED